MDFGQLRVTYVGDPRPAVNAATVVDRVNAQTAKNAAANDRLVERSARQLAQVRQREAKRAADDFIRELERMRRAERQGSGGGGGIGGELSTLAGGRFAFAGGGAVAGIGALAVGFTAAAKAGVGYAATIERLTKSFESLLGSQQAAAQHLKELQDFANRTPFEFEGVARASQRFQNMGLAAKDVIPTLTAVGNAVAAAGGGSEQIDRVSLAISQMAAKGKVSAEEMNQLAEAGVGGWKLLEQQTGRTKAELFKMAEAGELSADAFITAFRAAYGQGNQMQRQMETLSGSVSTLRDTGRQLLGEAFRPMHDVLRDITVELAKMTTEGWNTERALKAMATATRDLINTGNSPWFDKWLMLIGAQAGGAVGAAGMATVLGFGRRQPPRTWGEEPVQIPEQFRYKPRISDEELNKLRQGEFARQKDAYTADILRDQEEAQRKARQETERQAEVLKRISQDYAEASTRVTGFAGNALQLEAALYKLSIGFRTLSEENQKTAQAEINRLFSAKREEERLKARDELQKALNATIDDHRAGVEADGRATERVNEALAAFVDTGTQADETLRALAARATVFAAEMDTAAEMVRLAEQNSKSFGAIDVNSLLQPGTPTSTMGPQGGGPLDLSNVQVDQWKTFRESFTESLQHMREDGVYIFADMFSRIGENWRGAASGLVLDFAQALNQMAAQAAASVVWGALLNAVGGVLGGALGGGGKLPAANVGGGVWAGIPFAGNYASGGFIPPGKWGWTGEEGPEPVFGGRTGVTVMSNGSGQSKTVNLTVNFNGQGATPQNRQNMTQMARQLADMLNHELERGG